MTDADKSTNIFFGKKTKKNNPEQFLVFKALQVGPQMQQSKNLPQPMKGLKKAHGKGTNGQTSRLLDQIGPVGQFGENVDYLRPISQKLVHPMTDNF